MTATSPSSPLIVCDKLCVDKGALRAIDQFDLTLNKGQIVGVIGANGAGKSTLLRALAGLDPLTSGEVLIEGTALRSLTPSARARRLVYAPQHLAPPWPLRVVDMVGLGRSAGVGRPDAPVSDDILAALAAFDLQDLANHRLDHLSGGQLARAHLARSFATTAPILLLDEPTNSLDPPHQMALFAAARARLSSGSGLVVMALHDLSLAALWCDQVLVLGAGRLIAMGPPAQVLTPLVLTQAYGAPFSFASLGDTRLPIAVGPP